MTDTSGILSSLDRFIERFARHGELISDQRVATQNEPMGTTNSLTNNGINQSGHSGHPKQETFAGVDHERCGSHPSPAEISGAGLARKVLSVDGVTVVRMVSPFHINNLPVAIGKMSMATVVNPFRINSCQPFMPNPFPKFKIRNEADDYQARD